MNRVHRHKDPAHEPLGAQGGTCGARDIEAVISPRLASQILALVPIIAALASCSSANGPSFEPTENASIRPTPFTTPYADSPPGSRPTAPTTSPIAMPAPSIDWGPMAVALPPHNMHEALLEGVLRITAECIYLEPRGELRDTLLVWPNDRSAWRADVGGVQFANPDGEVVLVDGDRISLSGSGAAMTEPDEWIGTINWLSRPDPSCPLNAYWELNLVTKR